MEKPRMMVCMIAIVGAALCLAGNCVDPEYFCSDACEDLAYCENKWLGDEGGQPMSSSQFNQYIDQCRDDCWEGGEISAESDIKCIEEATCNELRDGKCRD